jgi:hypothetical protein
MGTPGLLLTEYARWWTAVGAVALIAFVHLSLLVAAPVGLDLTPFVALETALLVLLFGLELRSGASITDAVPLAAAFVGFLTATWGLIFFIDSLAVVSILLGGMSLLLVYGLHRYELVLLGLVNA